MAAGYVIGNIAIDDMDVYERYRAQVPATVEKYGGEYLVRGGQQQGMEGAEPLGRTVVLRFPSYQRALEWYNSPEYVPLRELRQSGSHGNLLIVEGAD